jgi:hypothetical protein
MFHVQGMIQNKMQLYNSIPQASNTPKVVAEPERSSQECSTLAPGKYRPKSTTVVTPLVKARLLALRKASLFSSTETSGIEGRTSFIAASINNPIGSA